MRRPFGLLLPLALIASYAVEAADPRPIEPGTLAPAWKELTGVDDKRHSLEDLKDAKVVVVAFTCNHCPVAVAYEDRFIACATTYADKGVRFVAINVSLGEEDRLEAMKERADAKRFPFPYLIDPSQRIGLAYGARVTPHLFVLDQARKVAYVGAFDDSMNPEKVKKQYVKDAVEALLAGKSPQVQKSRAMGCSVRYEN